MKMTPVKEVPGKTGHYCNLQGMLKSFKRGEFVYLSKVS